MLSNIFIIATAILTIPYCVLILLYKKWFIQLKHFQPSKNHQPHTSFSIIIPARNEENNIAKCLNTILAQNYPKELFEVIVIDDHSTDNTSNIIEDFATRFQNIKLINLKDELQNKPLNAYKKKAIEIAISKAKGNWIVTTDADCEVQQNWLLHFDDYIEQTNNLFVAAPVVFSKNKTIVSQFQFIDFMALQAATAATVSVGLHSMCNGANLAYHKNTFVEVGGFKGIDNIASGDDMLLMNKIKLKHKDKIGYLFYKESIVTTLPMPTWKSFINQRIRWASKADKYDDKSLLPVLLMVYLFNLSLVIMFICGLFNSKILFSFFVFFLIKTIVEWAFIQPASLFFGKIKPMQFALLQPLHIIYIVVAGWLGKFGTYKWKDRKVQ
ncbi:MAG: glycosyltransferase [Bacteroidetes bacterium]|nr:glycosyltransferase [Bacteroidota bacterium]